MASLSLGADTLVRSPPVTMPQLMLYTESVKQIGLENHAWYYEDMLVSIEFIMSLIQKIL